MDDRELTLKEAYKDILNLDIIITSKQNKKILDDLINVIEKEENDRN